MLQISLQHIINKFLTACILILAKEMVSSKDFLLTADPNLVTNKQFQPKETLVYSRLVKYAMQALDIYTINVATNGQTFVRPAALVSFISFCVFLCW